MVYIYAIAIFTTIMTVWYNTAEHLTLMFPLVILIAVIVFVGLGIIDAIYDSKDN